MPLDFNYPKLVDQFQEHIIKNTSSISTRLIGKTDKSGTCWLWKGALNHDGYGMMLISNKQISAHRVSYLIHHGHIRDGLCVLHSCDVRNCINPSHLSLGTRKENVERCSKKRENEKRGKPQVPQKTYERKSSSNKNDAFRANEADNYCDNLFRVEKNDKQYRPWKKLDSYKSHRFFSNSAGASIGLKSRLIPPSTATVSAKPVARLSAFESMRDGMASGCFMPPNTPARRKSHAAFSGVVTGVDSTVTISPGAND